MYFPRMLDKIRLHLRGELHGGLSRKLRRAESGRRCVLQFSARAINCDSVTRRIMPRAHSAAFSAPKFS